MQSKRERVATPKLTVHLLANPTRRTPAAMKVYLGVTEKRCFPGTVQWGYLKTSSWVGARRWLTTDCCESFKVWPPSGTNSAQKR